MATILFGPTVIGARGTIAGTVFSANKSGPYARGWSRGANPRTELQSAQRGRFGTFASAWRSLTQPQRDDWDAYAADPAQELMNSLGVTFFASGFNWFVRINVYLIATGAPQRDDAPALVRPVAPILDPLQFIKTGGPGVSFIQMDVTSPDITLNHAVFLRVVSVGRSAIASNFVFMVVQVPDAFRRITLQSAIETAFGTIVLDQRAFITVQIQDAHGQRGPKATDRADSV